MLNNAKLPQDTKNIDDLDGETPNKPQSNPGSSDSNSSSGDEQDY